MKGFGMNQPNMNQFAMNQSLINSGPFMGNPSGGMNLQGMSQRMDNRGVIGQTSPGYLPRFAGPLHNMGQPNLHPPGSTMIPHSDHQGDSRLSSDKMSLREAVHHLAMETKNIPNKWGVDLTSTGNSSAGMGMSPMPSSQVIEERRTPQSRYNTESATSILASFGLSNEDLEELSRYPDDQLTPENMPVILREIRLRKMNRQGPSVSAQTRGVGEPVQSKVFDYGHSSKLGFNDGLVQTRVFNDPVDDERRKDYRGMYTQGMDSHHSDNQERFHTEKSMGHMGFQKEAINKQIFPIAPANKMGAPSGQNPLSGTPPGLPIEVLNRKLLRNKNQPTPDNASDLQMGTHPMSNMPSFQMVSQPPSFSVGGPSSSYQLGNHPDLRPGGSPMNFSSHADGSMRPPTMPPPAGQTSYGKGNWSARSPQPDPTKTKLLPTPSMMNDYYAASPRIFPHMCSLCNIECKHIKDWIQHQNTTTHIESCRQIRSKYPDWNPQALGALRNEADKGPSPRGRSGSGSSSPRHSRSSGRIRRSRSRSLEKFTRPRSRSRSPRRAVRRSPRRSRSPRRISRSSPRYRKTSSGERTSRKTSRSPEKKFSDTGPANSKSAARTELGKPKNGKSSAADKRMPSKPEAASLRKPGSESTSTRKPGFAARYPSSDRTSPRKSSASADRASSKRLPSSSSQKLSTSSTLPKKSDGDSMSKKPVSSTSEEKSVTTTDESKKSYVKRKPEHVEAVVSTPPPPPPPPPSPKEAYHSLPWFKNKMDPGTVIHITDLPDDGYTDQDILKVVQPFGKASDILIIRCKNEAYLEMSFREAAIAAIKFSETVPVMINKKRVRLSSVGHKPQPAIAERREMPMVAQKKETVKNVPSKKQATITKPPSEKPPEKSLKPDFSQPKQANKVNPKASNVEKVPEVNKSTAVQKTEDSKKDVPGQKLNVKPMKKDLDFGVILVTNFPEKEYTAEEVANLAKPFGGVKDVILLSSHKQAYLQMSQSCAESMIKFYTVFPMSLAGKPLSIKLVPKYKSIKDVERIFIDIIEAEESKPRPEIHDEFVHLKNLPQEGYTDLEVAYVGLRFGKVNNYVVIRNKRKAILHLDSAKNARAMYNFLLNYPCCLGNTTLKCTLSPKRKPWPGETVIAEESDAGSEVENIDETECAQMVGDASAKKKLADTNTDHSSASSIQTNSSKQEFKNDIQPAKNLQKGESEEKIVTLSSKPLVKSGGVKKKLLKKKSTVTIEPFAKTLKFKRIALKPKVVKKTKAKGKGLDSHTDQVPVVEEASKTIVEASSSELVTDKNPANEKIAAPVAGRPGLDSQNSDRDLKSGVKQSIAAPKSTVDGGKPAGKNEMETGKNDQNHTEKFPSKTSEKNTNQDQSKLEVRNPSNTRSGASKKGISCDQSSTAVAAKQGGLVQKMTSTKSGEGQKLSSKPDVSKTTGTRNSGKESYTQKAGLSSVSSVRTSSTSKSSASISRRNTGKSLSSVQEKDERGESRSVPKSQDRVERSSTSKDDLSNKSSGKRSPKNSTSAETKESLEDHEMFPFNMDEFVTVDEIVEENIEEETSEKSKEAGKSPSKITEIGKRNESSKEIVPKDANSKKGLSTTPDQQNHSFVTLDEVGEEDAFAAQPEASTEDTKRRQTPVNENKKNRHVGKASHSVMTLDEVSDEEDFVDGKMVSKIQRMASDSKGKGAGLAMGRVKAVKETKTSNDGACSKHGDARRGGKADSSKIEKDEQVLVTVDEFNEEDDDFMHNLFSEDHQFVTVDEIGDEDDEDDKPHDEIKTAHKSETVNSTKATSEGGENKKLEGLALHTQVKPSTRSSTSAKPEDRKVDNSTTSKRSLRSESKSPAATPKKRQQVEAMQEQNNLNTAETDQNATKGTSKIDESKRRKLDLPAKMPPYDPKIAVGLEFLIPKTGYFCELCSLFYMDDSSKIKHCKTLRHYTCVEKHMAQQHELHLTEDTSSTVQEKL